MAAANRGGIAFSNEQQEKGRKYEKLKLYKKKGKPDLVSVSGGRRVTPVVRSVVKLQFVVSDATTRR